jgi:hypothetical protein
MTTKKRTLNRRERRQKRRKELRASVHAHLAVHGWIPMWDGSSTYSMRTHEEILIDMARGPVRFALGRLRSEWRECDWNDMRRSAFWRLRDFAVREGLLP